VKANVGARRILERIDIQPLNGGRR